MATREQERAQRAYDRVRCQQNNNGPNQAEYQRFAKRFPALIQSCGLAQALAFAQAKEKEKVPFLADLAHVVAENLEADRFSQQSRQESLAVYQKLTRDALAAATWLKRYSEALLQGEDK